MRRRLVVRDVLPAVLFIGGNSRQEGERCQIQPFSAWMSSFVVNWEGKNAIIMATFLNHLGVFPRLNVIGYITVIRPLLAYEKLVVLLNGLNVCVALLGNMLICHYNIILLTLDNFISLFLG